MLRVIGYTDSGIVVYKKYYAVDYLTAEKILDLTEEYIQAEGFNANYPVNLEVKYIKQELSSEE